MSSPNSRTLFLLPVIAWLAVAAPWGQRLPAGPQVQTFFSPVDETDQPYALYLPENFDEQRRYPLVVMLHGAWSNHRLALRRVFGHSNAPGEPDIEASRTFPAWPPVDFIVAAPLARGTMGYQGVAEHDVMTMVEDVLRRFPVDPDRMYLTGLSMGGGGTLWIGLTRPDLWAAIAPVCPAPPEGTLDLAGNALNVPVHLFQGGADPVVPAIGTRRWVERFKELGTRVEYQEYPGVQHNSWDHAYRNGFIFEWFSQFKRNPFPEKVRFATRALRYGQAYWLKADAFEPGVLAQVEAEFEGLNALKVTSTQLDGLTLELAGHPSFRPGQPLRITIDGTRLETSTAGQVRLNRQGGQWTLGAFSQSGPGKAAGREGPISEVVSGPLVYVYGTADSPPVETLRKRWRIAAAAADWAANPGPAGFRAMVYPRVLADREVRDSDLQRFNLVLFGDRDTNSLIARYADRLPLHSTAVTGEQGLLYVYPGEHHLLLISSGLPWWPAGEPVEPALNWGDLGRLMTLGYVGGKGFGFLPLPVKPLAGLNSQDFIVFTKDRVLVEGRFDRNWKVPSAAEAQLKAAGVRVGTE